ncbi:hypothetical protein EOJ36_11670 [Sandaracinomonas limnophila]|uniref:Uncharacterized protein n=1 Tax=Sandaracinomonas limnophila TaxID=1862386 RepID=A0A437PM76_9BACT|nr:hypothetical protein [Sandaracinomonas limnophila]RVU23383.1 hypothetical protein EOJ36_11670 [Sandaracinomonas limnophila]
MKKVAIQFPKLFFILAITAFIAISCQKDSSLVPSPTIQVNAPVFGVKGELVQLKAILSAEAGIEYVVVYKNGIAFDVQNFVGQKSVEYLKSYQIEDLPSGSKINFTFQATDQNGKSSQVKLLELMVK